MEDQIREAYAQGATQMRNVILKQIKDTLDHYDSEIREFGTSQLDTDNHLECLIQSIEGLNIFEL